jgi:hypothetical protein
MSSFLGGIFANIRCLPNSLTKNFLVLYEEESTCKMEAISCDSFV